MPRAAFLPLILGLCAAAMASTPPWRELLLVRTEIADKDNALVRWRPLYPDWTPSSPAIADSLANASSPLTGANSDPAWTTWLESAAPAVAQAVIRPEESLAFPRIEGPETPFPDHQPLRLLAMTRVALLKEAWAKGRHSEAVAFALDNLSLSRRSLAAQEGIIPLLSASGIWQTSLDGVYWLSQRPDLTPAEAATLQIALFEDRRLASESLTRAFRGELTFFTQTVLARFPRTRDPELLLNSIGTFGMAPPEAPAEGEPRLAVANRDIFDPESTLTAAAEDIRGWLDAFRQDRHPRGLSSAHTHARLLDYAREIPALLRYATEDGPPGKELIAAADAELASVENPVGKLFLIIATSQWEPISLSIYRREAERSALIGLLAWRRLGHAAPWKNLLTAGLLPEPPADPFGEGSLRQDPNPPRIWSLGANGTDEGGAGDGENLGLPDDLAWPAQSTANPATLARVQ